MIYYLYYFVLLSGKEREVVVCCNALFLSLDLL